MYRTTYLSIDLSAIRHNLKIMKSRLAPGTAFLAVVKANAYGHGAVPVAQAAIQAGADMLAVAIPEEGIELRKAGITMPILILGTPEEQAAKAVAENHLTQIIYDENHIRPLEQAASASGCEVSVHLALDTGMSRIGVSREQDVERIVRYLNTCSGVRLRGCMTHMACADEDEPEVTEAQIRRFTELCAVADRVHQGEKLIHHGANTASIFRWPELHMDMVRGGIALYGYPPVPEASGLRPAMQWITRAAYVKSILPGTRVSYGGTFTAERPTVVMTLPVGYADGYPRLLSGRGYVLVRGRRAPIIGRVCMDQMMVDVTDIPDAAAGDEVVLMGTQGQESITADDLAGMTGTISYEILCSPSARVPRIYVGD